MSLQCFLCDDTIAIEILALKFSMVNDYGLEYYFQIGNNDETLLAASWRGHTVVISI